MGSGGLWMPCSVPRAHPGQWLSNEHVTGTHLVPTLGLGLSSVQGLESA